MRTFIFASILLSVLCLTSLGAHAQTEYRIDQQLPDTIKKVQVYSGWNVRLIHDTVNMLSIATPCEYYFTEGNEPVISKLDSSGLFSLWKNTSMPKGTLVEIHYRDSLKRLDVHPDATVSADTLLLIDKKKYDEVTAIDVKRGGRFTADFVECNRWLSITADTSATVHIGIVKARHLQLWSNPKSTLMLDSIDARDVKYYRDPTVHDNLWVSDTARHIKVITSDRWFARGLNQLVGTVGIDWNTPYGKGYDNPYAAAFDIAVLVRLKTNIIPMSKHWGLSLGLDYGIPFVPLHNNVALNGRTLALDTVSPGVNRQHILMSMYLGVPVKLHYIPQGRFTKGYFNDLHIGLEPRWNFYQRYTNGLLKPNNRWDYNQSKVSIYTPLQVRAEIGCRINPFSNIEFDFYVDLLPTYRKETGMGNTRAFGFQIKF